MDHLYESPTYYKKLKKIEGKSMSESMDLLKAAVAVEDLLKGMTTKDGKKLTFAELEAKIRKQGGASDPAAVAAKVYRASGADPEEEKRKKAEKSMAQEAADIRKSLAGYDKTNEEWTRQFIGQTGLYIEALKLAKEEVELCRKYKMDDANKSPAVDPGWEAYDKGLRALKQRATALELKLYDAQIEHAQAQQAANKSVGASDLVKGGEGEGSRGGKIVGHTAGGKPVYASKHLKGMSGAGASHGLFFSNLEVHHHPTHSSVIREVHATDKKGKVRVDHYQVETHKNGKHVDTNLYSNIKNAQEHARDPGRMGKSISASPFGVLPAQPDLPLPYSMGQVTPPTMEHVGITGVELSPEAMDGVLSIIPPGSGGFEYEDQPGLAMENYQSIAECLEKYGFNMSKPGF